MNSPANAVVSIRGIGPTRRKMSVKIRLRRRMIVGWWNSLSFMTVNITRKFHGSPMHSNSIRKAAQT